MQWTGQHYGHHNYLSFVYMGQKKRHTCRGGGLVRNQAVHLRQSDRCQVILRRTLTCSGKPATASVALSLCLAAVMSPWAVHLPASRLPGWVQGSSRSSVALSPTPAAAWMGLLPVSSWASGLAPPCTQASTQKGLAPLQHLAACGCCCDSKPWRWDGAGQPFWAVAVQLQHSSFVPAGLWHKRSLIVRLTSRSSCTTPGCSVSAAACRGVTPCSAARLGSAPAFSRALTVSVLPAVHLHLL